LMKLADAARQLELLRFCTAVCDVVVSEDSTLVSVAATASGVNGSRFTDKTTKTSRSSGERFRSTDASLNVLGAVSSTEKPMDTMLELCFRPAGIDWGFPRWLLVVWFYYHP